MADIAAQDLNNNSKLLEMNGKAAAPPEGDSFLEILANLKDDELIRGTTPADLEARCLSLCRTYIGGTWAKVTLEQITVKRITGGLTNQLYKVSLNEDVVQEEVGNAIYREGEPRAVAIKLYEAKHMMNYHSEDDERLNDIIVLTIFSEVGMGPKVYGIFNGGFIQAFHEHEQFGLKHQRNPKLVRQAAQLLARVHHLNVPIRKTTETPWFLAEIQRYIDRGYSHCNAGQLIKDLKLPMLSKYPLQEEFAFVRSLHRSLTSTPVFCHCDFRCVNILVTQPDERILLVDLEYSAYLCRSYDIATFMMEWGQERFDFKNMGIPEQAALENFARLYIEACEQLSPGYSLKPENTVAEIVRETKLFIMTQYMFFVSFLFKQTESFLPAVPFDPITNMKYVEDCYTKYYAIKRQLIEEGVIVEK